MFTSRFYNLLIIITLASLLPCLALAVTNIDSADKYAWSEKIGWINFGTSSGNVQVTNTAVTGYAWHSEYGWINLAPTDGGLINNGSGVLSGRAWGEGTGWINFSGVSIDTEGYWSGYAVGDITGKISFNCANSNSCTSSNFKVRTTWRKTAPVTTPTLTTPNTSTVTTSTTTNNSTGQKMIINDGGATTNQRNVVLHFTVGSDIKYMAIANTDNFATASLETFQNTVNWTLTDGVGTKTVYAKLYTALGQANTLTAVVNYQTTDTVPTSDTVTTPTSGFADGNLVKEKNSSTVYLIDNGKKRIIPSAEVFNAQGFSWSQVIEVTDLSAYETGWPVTASTLVKVSTVTPTNTNTNATIATSATATNSVFTKDLTLGDINPEVKLLQQFLNQQGFVIADSGPGSKGQETEKFGRGTFNALVKWQEKYRAEVLTPGGFKKATGIFGPASRALASKLITTSPIVPTIPTTPTTTTPPPVASTAITTTPKTDLPSAKFDINLDTGMTNADVTRLQKLLASQPDVYPEGKITGFFGDATKSAVQRFQLKYQITTADHPAYGYVGPGTRAKLLEVFGQ